MSRSRLAQRRSVVPAIVMLWLIIGVIAVAQRGYLTNNVSQNCASAGTIALTVVSGPLNYFGVNPKVAQCNLPQPSL